MQQRLNIERTLSWYEYPLALTYMSHFIFPVGVAVVLWWISRELWVRYIRRLSILFLTSCLVFAAFPVAPPWLAAKEGYLEPISRITARAWGRMGIGAVSKLFDRGAAISNPYAAMPSLHAACALLVVVFFFPALNWWLRSVALVLPIAMAICLVYFGEHYVADIIAGWLAVWFSCWAATKWERRKVSV
jgi:membrane-associated phospholipid phosphatase